MLILELFFFFNHEILTEVVCFWQRIEPTYYYRQYFESIHFYMLPAIQTSSELFFRFFTPFDRIWPADHEKQVFTSPKYLFQVEKYQKLEGCQDFENTRIFQKTFCILLLDFSYFLKILFSNSASKTESRKVVKSTIDPDTFSRWRYESSRAQRAQAVFVNVSSFFT